jgi:hypothetical protein
MKQSTIKKKTPLAPKRLTSEERRLLKYIYLPGWQFDDTIKPLCIKLDCVYIGRSVDDKEDSHYVDVYGIKGQVTTKDKDDDTKEYKEVMVVNYFIKDAGSIYQEISLTGVVKLIGALKREHEINYYEEKYVWNKK